LNCGPGIRYSVQPSGQSLPVAAPGPFCGPLHFLRSKLAMCPLASGVHTTPSVAMSMPRGLQAPSGGTKTSESAVSAGLDPGMMRMT